MTDNGTFYCAWYSGPNCTYGQWDQVDYCTSLYQRVGKPITAPVAQCIIQRLTQLEQQILGTYSYVLSLWPAFVGILAGLGPDPSDIVHDNIWWATLFALTCGALPGMSKITPPHHMVVATITAGREACTAWEGSSQQPRVMARHKMIPQRGISSIIMEWSFFAGIVIMYFSFCIFLALSLGRTYVPNLAPNLAYAAWYYLSAGPAACMLVSEALQDRVDLYEPDTVTDTHMRDLTSVSTQSKRPYSSVSMIPVVSMPALAVGEPPRTTLQFHLVQDIGFVRKWWRVLRHQWQRTTYRLLVRPQSQKWPFQLWKLFVAYSRVAIFALGSIMMGGVMFLPTPNDKVLIVLLLLVSAGPRFSWPGFWARSPHGADLVVLVHPVDFMNYD